MNINELELQITNTQEVLTLILIGSLVASLLFAENKKLKLNGKIPYWNDEEVRTLTIIARSVVLVIAIVEVITLFETYDLLKKKGTSIKNLESAKLEIIASFVILIATIIILIAVINSEPNGFFDIENLGL